MLIDTFVSAQPQSAKFYKFLVSKETVLLLRWESETRKFGFIKRFDKGRITTVMDL